MAEKKRKKAEDAFASPPLSSDCCLMRMQGVVAEAMAVPPAVAVAASLGLAVITACATTAAVDTITTAVVISAVAADTTGPSPAVAMMVAVVTVTWQVG